MPSSPRPPAPPALPGASRAAWLKHLHQWHWVAAALSLLGMLVFSFTGITLNHATQIEARPVVTNMKASVPAALLPQLKAGSAASPLPPAVAEWAETAFRANLSGAKPEWADDEVYVPLPRPGGDAWLRIGFDGKAEYEKTDRGWISWLNDLHKGRNTGTAWSWFIDIFGIACLVFSITGFLILKFHAANRPSTWPVLGFGVVLPIVLALLFIH
jgi:hypothetical protein